MSKVFIPPSTRILLKLGLTVIFGSTLLLFGPLPISPVFAQDATQSVDRIVSNDEPRLIAIFKLLHADPELGFQEVKTSALVAKELKALGYSVQTGIGKTGVVGILKNGAGPVIMLREDMDALPVKEETNLDYASKKIMPGYDGIDTPVMHGCGHDAHTTWLIGTAKVMAQLKAQWSGTLILVAQPAEELGTGAVAMVKDGLYKNVPEPKVLISAHTSPIWPAGSVGLAPGRRMAGVDQLDVLIHGVGAHGSTPQAGKDPVVMGSLAVMAYQTIISREIDPQEPSVLTVGSFQAGNANNVIPDSALLKLNLRWYSQDIRDHMITSIRRVTDSIANAANMPADRMPEYTMKGHSTAVVNSDEAVKIAVPALKAELGASNVYPGVPPVMGSEDFQMLAEPFKDTQILWIEIGAAKPEVMSNFFEKGIYPITNHNPKFQVELPAIAAGVKADSAVLLEFLKKN